MEVVEEEEAAIWTLLLGADACERGQRKPGH